MDNKMNSKLCIICKQYKENLSIEHIIPDAMVEPIQFNVCVKNTTII